MDPVYDFGLEVTRWLQATYPQLESFLQLMSSLGQEQFYLALLPFVYWCFDKRLGKNLGYVFLVTNAINVTGKHAFRGPRPYWLDESIGLAEETSYGVPSGHTQLTTVIYGLLAGWYRKGWLTLLAILMILAMMLSRVFLGVHFVHDIAAGFLLGVLILAGFFLWRRYRAPRFDKLILGQKLLTAVLIPLSFALIYTLIRFLIGQPDTAVAWASYIPEAELAGLEGIATAVGALLGFGIGVHLEASRTHFLVDGPLWQRGLRYLVGMAVTFAIWMGLSSIFPDDPLWLAIPLRIVRYLLTLLWVGYYAPAIFVRIRLAGVAPESEIKHTL